MKKEGGVTVILILTPALDSLVGRDSGGGGGAALNLQSFFSFLPFCNSSFTAFA